MNRNGFSSTDETEFLNDSGAGVQAILGSRCATLADGTRNKIPAFSPGEIRPCA